MLLFIAPLDLDYLADINNAYKLSCTKFMGMVFYLWFVGVRKLVLMLINNTYKYLDYTNYIST